MCSNIPMILLYSWYFATHCIILFMVLSYSFYYPTYCIILPIIISYTLCYPTHCIILWMNGVMLYTVFSPIHWPHVHFLSSSSKGVLGAKVASGGAPHCRSSRSQTTKTIEKCQTFWESTACLSINKHPFPLFNLSFCIM